MTLAWDKRLLSQHEQEETRHKCVGVVSAGLQHCSLHGFVAEASVNMLAVKIKPSFNGSCNGSCQTYNSCCLPRGNHLCIAFLKSVVHMQFICEYVPRSADIDVCKWTPCVSFWSVQSVKFSGI